MHIRRLATHGLQQASLILSTRKRSEFDARAVRRQAPDHPASLEHQEWIRAAHCAVEDLLMQPTPRRLAARGPSPGRRDQRLGFSSHLAACPIRNGGESLAAQTPKSRLTMNDPQGKILRGQERLNALSGTRRDFPLHLPPPP